jgi:hypothetical protein
VVPEGDIANITGVFVGHSKPAGNLVFPVVVVAGPEAQPARRPITP